VTYNYKIRVNRATGQPLNLQCECPAGKGPHGTCKHIAAVFLMILHFINTGDVQVEKCDILHTNLSQILHLSLFLSLLYTVNKKLTIIKSIWLMECL
jgi:hypothetical protein